MVGLAGDHVIGPVMELDDAVIQAARSTVARYAHGPDDETRLLDALGLGEG